MYVCMYVCMYETRDRQDPVKGSGWVLFPSTMAGQPIQQMVAGHLCFQELTEQYYILTGPVSLSAKLVKVWGVRRRSRCPAGERRPTSCHRGRRDGRFLNPSRTCIVDKWLQTHPERAKKSSYSCGRLALVLREPIYVKYLCPS